MIVPTSSVGRVMVAPDDDPSEWTPTWVCLDVIPNLVSGIDIERGRQTEFDTTDTSTAVVYLNDTQGLLDPANTGSSLFGLEGKQITLQAWDPVASAWVPQTRMWIDEITYLFNPSTADGKSILSNVQLQCVDIFDFLAGIAMDLTEVTGDRVFGDPPPAGYEANVFYEDTDQGDGTGFQLRVTAILDDCDLTTDWYVVFTGNIDVLEGLYDPGDSPLTAIRDALDAEFPGIANGYSDKLGRFVAHGRKARFDPDTVSSEAGPDVWNFRRWKAGDGAAIALDGDRAQIREPLSWSRDRKKVYNVGYAYPKDISPLDKPGQYVVAAGDSIDDFGRRTWNAENILVKRGTTTGNNGNDEAKLYANFFVTNYQLIRTRVDALTLLAIDPADPRAAATWEMALGADISDVVNLAHGYPGPDGVGISEDWYIEGSSMQIRPLNPEFDMVTVSFNVTPTDYYSDEGGLLG